MPYTMIQIWLVTTVGAYIGVYLLLRVLYPDEKMMTDTDIEPTLENQQRTSEDPQGLPPEDQQGLSPGSAKD